MVYEKIKIPRVTVEKPRAQVQDFLQMWMKIRKSGYFSIYEMVKMWIFSCGYFGIY